MYIVLSSGVMASSPWNLQPTTRHPFDQQREKMITVEYNEPKLPSFINQVDLLHSSLLLMHTEHCQRYPVSLSLKMILRDKKKERVESLYRLLLHLKSIALSRAKPFLYSSSSSCCYCFIQESERSQWTVNHVCNIATIDGALEKAPGAGIVSFFAIKLQSLARSQLWRGRGRHQGNELGGPTATATAAQFHRCRLFVRCWPFVELISNHPLARSFTLPPTSSKVNESKNRLLFCLFSFLFKRRNVRDVGGSILFSADRQVRGELPIACYQFPSDSAAKRTTPAIERYSREKKKLKPQGTGSMVWQHRIGRILQQNKILRTGNKAFRILL